MCGCGELWIGPWLLSIVLSSPDDFASESRRALRLVRFFFFLFFSPTDSGLDLVHIVFRS